MQVVINIMKLSSFSFTKMSPQIPTTSLFSGKNLTKTNSKRAAATTTTTTTTAANRSPSSRLPKSLMSQEVQKPVSYLLEPFEDKDKSVYVINNREPETGVDGMASDYIKKVYGKINVESSDMPRFSSYTKSPHPPRLTLSYVILCVLCHKKWYESFGSQVSRLGYPTASSYKSCISQCCLPC